ncbi:DUF4272 domain-containing protein [Fulvivirga sediminis]|uniref:DUF4272 domain-containing protein n=1 Tax=Fulvivirga sediminis TaxID=2803949 RepID=A0A937F5I7_9BACT|nr:DUF4272 domain-containing protein [Fulvivirga sediminis]MBL3656150.1 DUF4272 domain-containing protein [Fulvivirga sediminis]
MENCTIYSHYLEFQKILGVIKSILPNAKLEVDDHGLEKSVTVLGSVGSSLKVNYRERKTPSYKLEEIECGLTQNLAGMVNFVQSLPATNTDVKNKFIYKIMSMNCEIALMAEPKITESFKSIIGVLVQDLDGFIFAQPNDQFTKSETQHFLNKDLNLIIDLNGNCEIDDLEVNVNAAYMDEPKEDYTEEQQARRGRSGEFLKEKGIAVNEHLPCVPDQGSVEIRALKEVIDRAYALLVISAKGEGVEQEHLQRAVAEKGINSFTEQEQFIYNADVLSDEQRAYATWRYESLYVLLWSLGKFDDLIYPDNICNVSDVVSSIFQPTREEFEANVKLRSKEEILDALDMTYRMHWACVNARINGREVGGGIIPSVIYERHYALNWLTHFMDQQWDDVQTPT